MEKVLDTITIEKLEGGAFNVVQGNKYSDTLSYDEMLGLVSALTIAKEPNCLRWMQTKEEHEVRFNNLKKSAEDIREVEFEDILVPKGIGIYQYKPEFDIYNISGDRLYVGFNAEKQVLGFSNGVYEIIENNNKFFDKVQCKLIPCNREDLKAGDTAFSSSLDNPLLTIDKLYGYAKILDNGFIVHVSSDLDGIIVRSYPSDSWYKVVPV